MDAGFEELCSLVGGGGEPSAGELAQRHATRTSLTREDAPPVLGDPPSPPPEGRLVHGLAASPGVYEDPPRRVAGPAEFDRIQQGDVLVTESTTEAFNILLPLLGGIVPDSGGLLSHAAIVARARTARSADDHAEPCRAS